MTEQSNNSAAPVAASAMSFDLVSHLYRQRAFSLRTFGPGDRQKGVVAHIRKELAEIEEKPTDLTEWIDVAILAFDGAWRAGHSPEAIAAALAAKQAKNEGRTWPDWRTVPQDKPIEHDRTGEALSALAESNAELIGSGSSFKVGDRVVCRNYMGSGKDCYGTVTQVDGARVYSDDWSIGRHDGFLDSSYLELAEAAPAPAAPALWYPDDRPWIEHNGGKRPVDASKTVEVLLRHERAEKRYFRMTYRAGHWPWNHKNQGRDVVAYLIEEGE